VPQQQRPWPLAAHPPALAAPAQPAHLTLTLPMWIHGDSIVVLSRSLRAFWCR
jgi:hypothetical protein